MNKSKVDIATDAMLVSTILKDSSMTATALSEMLGISKQYVSYLISGKRGLGPKTLKKLKEKFPKYFETSSVVLTEGSDKELIKSIRAQLKLTRDEFADKLGISMGLLNLIETGHRNISKQTQEKIDALINPKASILDDFVPIKFRPEVYLSAGYGYSPVAETDETVYIDKKILVTPKGLTINHKCCEIVTVSGDSMSPEYRHGDRVIVDRSVNTFIDGHIFAFGIDNECYIKLINLLPDKIKCIPLNKEYDTFYIDKSDNFRVFGMIVPRIRL